MKTNKHPKFIHPILMILFFQSSMIGQSATSHLLPDCEKVQNIKIEIDENLLEESRYLYSTSKDTLSFLYCHAKKTNNQELMANSMAKLAAYTINSEHDDKAFERFVELVNKTIKISEAKKFKIPLTHAYELLISNFTEIQLYDLATIYSEKLIKLGRASKDSTIIAEGHMHLGRMYRNMGRYEPSDSVLQIAINHFIESESSFRTGAYAYLHLSNLKRKEGWYEESVEYAKKGIALAEKTKHHPDFQIANLTIELILSNIELGELGNEEWLKKLDKLCLKYKWLKGQNYHIKGLVSERKGDTQNAIKNYLEGLKLSNKAASYQTSLNISQKIAPLLLKEEMSTRAHEAYVLSQDASSKILKQNGSNSFIKGAFLQLENQKLRANLMNYKLKNSHIFIGFSICLLLLVSIFSVMTLKQYQKTKKLNDALSTKNKELAKFNEEIIARKNELSVEMKQKLLLLYNQNSMISELEEYISNNKELSKRTQNQLIKLTNIKNNNSIIEDINEKFLKVNDAFVSKLSTNFPKLTAHDLKLCVYISMNLTIKEIAQIQYKLPESVKTARSRLRKKLGIRNASTNLFTFLNGYKTMDGNMVTNNNTLEFETASQLQY